MMTSRSRRFTRTRLPTSKNTKLPHKAAVGVGFGLGSARLKVLCYFAITITVCLSAVDLTIFGNVEMFLYTAAILLVATLTLRMCWGMHEIFIGAHPALFFVTMIYAYAFLHARSVSFGLNEPILALQIALCLQLGTSSAILLHRVYDKFVVAVNEWPVKPHKTRIPIGLSRASITLISIGLISQIMYRFHILGEAFAYILGNLAFVGLACRIAMRGRLFPLDASLATALTVGLVISMLSNSRTAFLIYIIFLAFAHLQYSPVLFRKRYVVITLILANFLAVFSDIALSSRTYMQYSYGAFQRDITGKIFTPETVVALLNPFYEHPASRDWASQQDDRNLFSTQFFEGNISILQRLTVLPQMDIVLPGVSTLYFRNDELLNIVYSLLPSFGQPKDLILSDRITWDQGLREYGNVGRPMITAAGEFFYIGGLPAVYLLSLLAMFCLLFSLRILRIAIGDDDVFGLTFPIFLMFTTITTTALSIFQESTRSCLVLAGMLALVNVIFGRGHEPKNRFSSA